MKYPKIKSAVVIDRHTILVEFSNQEKRKYDITRLLSKEMFFPLKNPAFLKNFKIDPAGYALIWNEDIDLSEHELWTHGVAVSDSNTEKPETA